MRRVGTSASMACAILACVAAGSGNALMAQNKPYTLTTLHDFTGGADGYEPTAALTIGPDGVLYGTTVLGGTSVCQMGCGTVFSMTQPASGSGPWTETQLYVFQDGPIDGANPFAGVTIASGPDGRNALYGVTHYAGELNGGIAYELTPPAAAGGLWNEKVLYYFSGPDGYFPTGGLVAGSGGVLYGVTVQNGSVSGVGTIFSLTPPAVHGGSWTHEVLYNFSTVSGGYNPIGKLVLGPGGILYGAATLGGTNDAGTIFSLTPPVSPGNPWTYTELYSFLGGDDGSDPYAGMAVDKRGVLYGTTIFGGPSDDGTVFSLTPPSSPGGPWTHTVLYSFTGQANGATANGGVIIGPDGVLYGADATGGTVGGLCADGCGTVYSLTPPATPGDDWTLTVLHRFTAKQGVYPASGLAMAADGSLFGTTESGGDFACPFGCGTVYSLKR